MQVKVTKPSVIANNIRKITEKKRKQIEAATRANAQELATQAKRNAPKDLSSLAKGIQFFEVESPWIKYAVVATEKYSPYVEFGTGDKVEVPPGLEDYAMQFYVNGEGTMPAQPFMYPALQKIRKQYIQDIKDIVNGKITSR